MRYIKMSDTHRDLYFISSNRKFCFYRLVFNILNIEGKVCYPTSSSCCFKIYVNSLEELEELEAIFSDLGFCFESDILGNKYREKRLVIDPLKATLEQLIHLDHSFTIRIIKSFTKKEYLNLVNLLSENYNYKTLYYGSECVLIK